MFINKKLIEELQANLDNLNNRVKNQNMELAKLKESNDELTTELDDSRNNLKALGEQLNFLNETFKQINDEARNEITDLKLFLSKTKKDIVNDLNVEFSNEMQTQTEQIHTDLEAFRELKIKIDGLNTESGNMKTEILKFIDIANKIKNADFELQNYAKVLEEGDKEKLELMKKIDNLERLVAKQRRSH